MNSCGGFIYKCIDSFVSFMYCFIRLVYCCYSNSLEDNSPPVAPDICVEFADAAYERKSWCVDEAVPCPPVCLPSYLRSLALGRYDWQNGPRKRSENF